jgi:hypothetical protein
MRLRTSLWTSALSSYEGKGGEYNRLLSIKDALQNGEEELKQSILKSCTQIQPGSALLLA